MDPNLHSIHVPLILISLAATIFGCGVAFIFSTEHIITDNSGVKVYLSKLKFPIILSFLLIIALPLAGNLIAKFLFSWIGNNLPALNEVILLGGIYSILYFAVILFSSMAWSQLTFSAARYFKVF